MGKIIKSACASKATANQPINLFLSDILELMQHNAIDARGRSRHCRLVHAIENRRQALPNGINGDGIIMA